MAQQKKDAAEAATAEATARYASPLSTMTLDELRAEYESVTGQSEKRILTIIVPVC